MKTLTTLFIALITFSANAQLNIVKTEKPVEIGKVANFGNVVIECNLYGDEYRFTYNDIKFQKINSYKSFSVMGEETFNDLYDFIMDNWDNPPNEDTMIDLGNDTFIWLNFTKALGVTNVRFSSTEGGNVFGFSGWLTKKRIDRLFGK